MALTKIEASNIAAGAVASSGFVEMKVYTVSATGGWTKPADVTKLIVEVQGGGGGGSRSTDTAWISGGAGGGYVRSFIDVTNIDAVDLVVGAAGAGVVGAGGGAQGTDGGTTSFTKAASGGGSGSFTALVGNGGPKALNSDKVSTPGTGGTGPAGCLIITSGPTAGGLYAADGGHSMLGFGGCYSDAGYTQLPNASGYGAGGGGAYNTTTGNGTQGVIIVMEYK